MLNRLFPRLLDSVTLLLASAAAVGLVATVAVLGIAVLNGPSTPASSSTQEQNVTSRPRPAANSAAADTPEILASLSGAGTVADSTAEPSPQTLAAVVDPSATPAETAAPDPSPTPTTPAPTATDTPEVPPPSAEPVREDAQVADDPAATGSSDIEEQPQTATPVALPPSVPHPLQGREACTTCHTVGGSGVGAPGGTGLPPTHEGRGDPLCLTCHDGGQTAADTPTATAVAAPAALPPDVPHATAGREDCLSCHAVGGPGVGAQGGTGLPDTHQGRASASCLGCHAASAAATAATPAATTSAAGPPVVPHSTAGRSQCTACHTVGGPGVGSPGGTGLASSHQGRADSTCLSCHTVSSTTTSGTAGQPAVRGPSIEHSLQGRTECTNCHVPQGTAVPRGGKAMPRNHQGRTSDSCLLCHQPGAEGEHEDDDGHDDH